MRIHVEQRSALEKIFLDRENLAPDCRHTSCLGGEEVSWQVVLGLEGWGTAPVQVQVDSPLGSLVELYQVEQVPCALPAYPAARDENYLRTAPGLFPDPLVPLEGNVVEVSSFLPRVLWVNVKVPKGYPAGTYPVHLQFTQGEDWGECTHTLQVIGADLPVQKLLYTQWMHGDCLADAYGVEIYSPAHWKLWEQYLRVAAEEGVNLVLTPIFTPPLDTEPGMERPCVQLVDVEREGDRYRFGFDRLGQFIAVARRCGVERFEMAHLFSQWGAEFAPNIYGTEQGIRHRLFGWDTPASSPAYRNFLAQFLPELVNFLGKQGLEGKVVFHISDEPGKEHLDSYRRAKEMVKPYLGDFPLYDALSDPAYYDSGLVDHPVAASNHIGPFLERQVPGLWTYTCCGQNVEVGNRFLAMPSARNRILGWQLYKFRLSGFLHWGYNFWYSQNSRRKLDPWQVTDGGGAFPGGDPFSVYPGKSGPIQSLRQKVFHQGLQDLRALELAQSLTGKDPGEQVLPGYGEMTFARYPQEAETLLKAREALNRLVERYL